MDVSSNYFELFDLPVSFEVDLALLREKYQELQKAVHPDRYASAGEQARLLSVQKAALINDAFSTLKAPLARAKYLLHISGVEYDDEKNTIMDPEFLMQQMDLREAIAAVPGKKDPYDAIAQVIDDIEKHIKQLHKNLSNGFENMTSADASRALIDDVRKLQFFEKLLQEALSVETNLDS